MWPVSLPMGWNLLGERPSWEKWIRGPWGGVGGLPQGEYASLGALPPQGKINTQALVQIPAPGEGGASPPPPPKPSTPLTLSDLLSSQMRTALPEAA